MTAHTHFALGMALTTHLRRASADAPAEAYTDVLASEPVEDRLGTIVDSEWRLENYQRNPVVLWAHDDSRLPLGTAKAEVRDGKLYARITWDMADPFAAEVARKFDAGVLSAVSVRWRSEKVLDRSSFPKEHPYHSQRGVVFQGNDLYEISAVPIPGLQTALAEGRSLHTSLGGAALEAQLRALLEDDAAMEQLADAVAGRVLRGLLPEPTTPTPDPLADLLGITPA